MTARSSRMRYGAFGLLAAALLVPGHARAESVWPSGHARILAGLESKDTAARRGAAAHLLELPERLATERAKAALHDADLEVRIHAARAAIALRIAGAGDDVTEWLQEQEPRLRATACEVIESSPSPESVAALGRVLSDGRPEVREAAARALGASGFPEAVAPLLGHLDDGSLAVRVVILRALGRLGDVRAAVPLVSKLQDAEPEVRRESARALGVLGDRQALPPLELALGDKEPAVRLAALEALGRLASPSSVPAISSTLAIRGGGELGLASATAASLEREAAFLALARIQTPDALRVLVTALDEEGPVPYVDEAAAKVRRAWLLAGPSAAPTLIQVLAQPTSNRQASAAALTLASLAADGAPDAALTAILGAASRGTVDRATALLCLERLAHPAALPFVIEVLDDPDAPTRQLAVSVASKLLSPARPDGRVVDVVRGRLSDPASPVDERIALVRMLGRTGATRSADVLLPLLPASRSADGRQGAEVVPLTAAVVDALGFVGAGNGAALRALLEAIGHDAERVRVAAAKSLARIGDDATASTLLGRLETSAEQDRAALGIALSGSLAHARDPGLVTRAARALSVAAPRTRDALIEGLGRSAVPSARAALETFAFASSSDAADRRKVAEGLAHVPASTTTLSRLAADADASVRAAAVWSLGFSDASALPVVQRALTDSDVTVAGNAATSLGRLGRAASERSPVVGLLCATVRDSRSYVALGAITGLLRLGARCEGDAVRQALLVARSADVRRAAAALLAASVAASPTTSATNDDPKAREARRVDRLALLRCAQDDRDGRTAKTCRSALDGSPSAAVRPRPNERASVTNDLLVYVVPEGSSLVTPSAPFALRLPDGTIRLGFADRRGAVFERGLPDGQVELAVPAPLAP